VDDARGDGRCGSCGHEFRVDGALVSWADATPETQPRDLRALILRQLNPLGSRLSPLRYFSDWRVEEYYRRTVSDLSLADSWARHYLAGLNVPRGAGVLDHGCGRGRNAARLAQLGFDVAAQDVRAHSWWRTIRNCRFQQVPTSARHLPWTNNAFALVLDVEVVHHLDQSQLEALIAEVHRVLAPGGYWLLLEANAESYGAAAPRRYCGRLHTLEHVQRLVSRAGFREVDHSYEGVYAPVFPVLFNFVRKQAWPGPFTIDDFDSGLAQMIPARRRALWLLRLQKPAHAA
jgi:SAM-dependent methyltransferase